MGRRGLGWGFLAGLVALSLNISRSGIFSRVPTCCGTGLNVERKVACMGRFFSPSVCMCGALYDLLAAPTHPSLSPPLFVPARHVCPDLKMVLVAVPRVCTCFQLTSCGPPSPNGLAVFRCSELLALHMTLDILAECFHCT